MFKALKLVSENISIMPESYMITLVKSEPIKLKSGREEKIFYQKEDFKSQKRYPWKHRVTTKTLKSFKDLYDVHRKLLHQPQVAQVLGRPKPSIVKDSLIVQRIKDNFSFYDYDSLEPLSFNHVVFEYDGPLDDPYLTEQYKTLYASKALTQQAIIDQSRHILQQTFGLTQKELISIPLIVRLSSSFYKTQQPAFRAHLIAPTTPYLPLALNRIVKTINPSFDPHIYRAPNNVLYTSAPSFKTEKDPLTTNDPPLDRLFYLDGNAPLDLASYIEKTIPVINRQIKDSEQPQSAQNAVPAWHLDGDAGIFNLYSKYSKKAHTIESWLLEQGYTRFSKYRYISPQSTSGSAGLMILPGGYLFDHHESSPIIDMIPHPKRMLTAYDLYYHTAVYEGRLDDFRRLMLQIRSKSPEYKSQSCTRIKSALEYLSASLAKADIDTLVHGVLRDIFESQIDNREQQEIFQIIVDRTRNAESRYFKKTIDQIMTEFKIELAQKLHNIDPRNADYLNADHFLENVNVYYNKEEKYFLVPDPSKPVIISPTMNELERIIEEHLYKLTTTTAWSTAKMQSTIKAIQRRAMTTESKLPEYSPHIYLFKDSYQAINIYTKEIFPLPQTHYVENILPFTFTSWERQTQKPVSAWYEFLNTSLPDKSAQLLLQNLFAYLFSPIRKEQKILFMYGVERSGKSTIKNLMAEFFKSHEFDADKILDNFILEHFTPITRLLVVNEFNARTSSKNVFSKVVNLVKEVSGRDPVSSRGLYKSNKSFKSDALPIMISNQVPVIKDRAFQSRLIPIQFRHSFKNTSSHYFWKKLTAALPTIFNWAIEKLGKDKQVIRFSKLDGLSCYRDAKRDITMSLDFLTIFCEKYLIADPEQQIDKNMLQQSVRLFYEQEFDQPLPDSFPATYPTRFMLSKYFPNAALSNGKRIIDRSSAQTIKGLKWRDEESMIKELSQFGEYINQ